MSHDLRTPMSAVLGMMEIVLLEELPPAVRDCLETAKDSADKLLMRLNDILDFSRIEAGGLTLEQSPFHLGSLLDETIRLLEPLALRKGLRLLCEHPEAVRGRFHGDAMRLQQILTNLVSNAIKFTEKGQVAVRAEWEESGIEDFGLVEASTGSKTSESGPLIPSPQSLIPAGTLHFTVSDTGIGIPPEDHEKIFSPFTQANTSMARRFGGTGLGLSIAKNLVGLMGGSIWVESRPSQGSNFHFTVPLEVLPPETGWGRPEAAPKSAVAEGAALRPCLGSSSACAFGGGHPSQPEGRHPPSRETRPPRGGG